MDNLEYQENNITYTDSGVCHRNIQKTLDALSQKKRHWEIKMLKQAGVLALKNKNWTLAEKFFSFLLTKECTAFHFTGLARALENRGHFSLSEKYYMLALDKITKPCFLLFVVYKALGKLHVLQNNFYQAEEYYNKASTLKPNSSGLILHYALMRLKEKNFYQAEERFKMFLKTHPCSTKAWLGLALSRKALGDDKLALACLYRCLDLDPEHTRAMDLRSRWELSQHISSNSFCFSNSILL